MKQNTIPGAPEEPYLWMLKKVLHTLHQHSQDRESLSTAVWLIYRILDINAQAVLAYLALAYIFALVGEWSRAYQIMLFAAQEFPADHRVQFACQHYQRHLKAAYVPFDSHAAVMISFGSPTSSASGTTHGLQDLPSLTEVQLALKQNNLHSQEIARRFKSLRAVLVSLAEKVKEAEHHEKG